LWQTFPAKVLRSLTRFLAPFRIELLLKRYMENMNMIKKLLKRFITPEYDRGLQTVTYYIPAPPPRKTGYREKQFDKLFYHFFQKGFELINLQTQAHTGENHSGIWIICVVRALNKNAQELDLDFFDEEISNESILDLDSNISSLDSGTTTV
jgi:hypothetical protein